MPPRFDALPPRAPGLRVGLLGGSFNPAHDGHLQASLTALRRLGLDAVWWLVTPGNPLKDNRALPSLAARVAGARLVARDRRIRVTGLEARLGTRFTADTLAALVGRHPGVRFVWIMGADNLSGVHRWRGWRRIFALVPIAVIDRPGSTLKAARSRAAIAFGRARTPESEAARLPLARAPAWVFIHGRRSALSSSAIRARASVEATRGSG